MLNEIKYESFIELEKVPLQWTSKFELYYPDLPLFPISYIHKIIDNKRVYGFPAYISFESADEKSVIPKAKKGHSG